MRQLLRSTTAACTGAAMLFATNAAAQTLPTAQQVAGLEDRQCLRLLRTLGDGDDAPEQLSNAASAQAGPAGSCESLSGLWDMVSPDMLDEDTARLLSVSLRQSGVDITVAEMLPSDEVAEDIEVEELPPIQTLPSADEVAALQDRQCVRLLRMLGEDADAPASVTDAANAATGPAGSCDTLSGLWGDVQPNMFNDESAGLLNAALRQPAAALAGDAEAAETVTETVTEDTARSSDEDFAKSDDGGGMSTMEKALLAGAGALVAGAIISNNRSVVNSTPDRVVVESEDGDLQVLKDDNALLRQPGSQVATQTFDDGSSRTVVTREDGSQIVTIRDAELRVVRRSTISADGRETVLIDDTAVIQPVDVSVLPEPAPEMAAVDTGDADALRAALEARNTTGRSFSLAQVRDIDRVRKLAPAISVDNITFESGSAAIRPSEAEELAVIGRVIADAIALDPGEVFLVEGHTDAVGGAGMNLLLSDRRAESVALALSEYFDVPPENLVVQGYGESDLRIATDQDERANRRAVVRRVTPLLRN